MSIPVSKIVKVNIFTSPTFPKRKGFGLLNIIGRSARLPLAERIRFYADMDGVAQDFAATDEEYLAAQVFFSQSPAPRELAISRRFETAVGGQLMGSVSIDQAIAGFKAVSNGGFDIVIDGVNRQVTTLDFSAAANLNAVAAAVQTRLALLVPGTTCVWSGKRFIITSGTTGATSTVTYATAPTGAGSPVDVSGLLGLRAADQGIYSAGTAAEATMGATLDALQAFDPSWYGFVMTKEATEDQLKQCAAWAESRVKIFGYSTRASNVQDASVTADIASFCKNNLYRRTIGVWDDNDDYPVVSALSRGFVVNFEEYNSTLTLKFKQLPGISPVTISESQRLALTGKNINYYSKYGDSAMLAEGVMASGTFFDEVHGLDWLQNAVETEVFGYLYTRTTKVPQTDKGVAALVQQVDVAMRQGVNNGLLAPGYWNGMDLGEVKSGDFLPKGFYTYAQPVRLQSQSDRQARKAPPIQVIAKGAGAIHSVDVSITFER